MGQCERVSSRAWREAYLLLGECCALGVLAEGWCERFHEGLVRLLDVQVSVLLVGPLPVVLGCSPPGAGDGVLTFGWPSVAARQLAQQYFRRGAMRDGPLMPAWSRIGGLSAIRSRRQLVDDRAWYESPHYRDYYRHSGSDHPVLSRCRLPTGQHMLVNVWRQAGRRAFTIRELDLLRLLHREVAALYGTRLAPLTGSKDPALTPRIRQVLGLLVQGLGEKEIAQALRISPHTVHDHVKALYRQLGVRSRAELLSRLRGWARNGAGRD